jgi:cytochrome b561
MKNTISHYGWITISVHWLVAITVVGLFCLGYWMVDLGYYDPWYKQGPELHKSIGILLFIVMLIRVIWRYFEIKPETLNSHTRIEKKIGSIVHVFLYSALFVLMISGYLISTADGRAIVIFDRLSVASLGELFTGQEDLSGIVHKYLAYALIFTVVLHALAAFKHHFIDKDNTLLRMLGKRNSE